MKLEWGHQTRMAITICKRKFKNIVVLGCF